MNMIRHGLTINELQSGRRPLAIALASAIGLVVTGPDADVEAFPLDTPVLVTNIRQAIGKAGTEGTLAPTLNAIADQTNPVLVIVRVDPGDTAAEQMAAVVGTTTEAGRYTGLQALLAAEAQLGVKPKILAAPGLDSAAVRAELIIAAKRLRGFVFAAALGDTVSEAVTDAATLSAREIMLIWPGTTAAFAGDAVARAVGLRARIDAETGWHKTLSNVALDGVIGLDRDIYFDITNGQTDAGVLNSGNVTTLVRLNGYRFWGNRTCSDDPLFRYESTVRTAHALQDAIADGMAWAVDKPITTGLVRDIIETINAAFRRLKSEGRIIDANAWYDPDANPAADLADGKLVIDFDYTPCAPAEDLTFNMRITDRYYSGFADALVTR